MESVRLNKIDLHSTTAISELLQKGSWEDWKPLYQAIAQDGEIRAKVAKLIGRQYFLCGNLWKLLLTRIDSSYANIVPPEGEIFVP